MTQESRKATKKKRKKRKIWRIEPRPCKSSGSIRASGLLALVPSGPRALPYPGFCGLILHIVPYPILGSYLDPFLVFGFILHIF